MLDFGISAITNFLRIYLIYRFVNIFFEKTEEKRERIFLVCVCFYVTNTALFWIFHTVWINIICNLVGIGAIVRLYTKSLKTNLFVTASIYLINMGCDVASTMLFIQYEDGQRFDQIYEVVSVFMILVCLILAGKIITIHRNAEQTQNTALILVPLCSIAVLWLLIYLEICEEVGIAIVAMGLLVINFFMLYLYNQLLHSVLQKYETEMLKNQVKIYANQLDVIFHSEEKVKALRHDMKYHMNELKLMAGKYDAVEIQDYIDHMEYFLHNPREIVSSGNVEIDSVLNYMLQRAKEELKTVRGIDANGERVTFASKTYKGLFETDQMIKRLAQDNNIEFVGYNAMYVLIDSTQIISVQNDDLTFLIETSIADVPATLSNEKSVEFPHSLAWTIEELH